MQDLINAAKRVVNNWGEFGPEFDFGESIDWLEKVIEKYATRPRIVCLCGSTRFWRTFQEASLRETLAGKIVLSIGAASGTDDDHFGNLPREEYDRVKGELDQLHFRKIELADEVLILNVGGYIGQSTANELAHALKLRKLVRFWEEPSVKAQYGPCSPEESTNAQNDR